MRKILIMNNTLSQEVNTLQFLTLFILNFNFTILLPYVLPTLIILVVFNNLLTIYLLSGNAELLGISKTIQLYYVVFALQDLFVIFACHLWDFTCMNYKLIYKDF